MADERHPGTAPPGTPDPENGTPVDVPPAVPVIPKLPPGKIIVDGPWPALTFTEAATATSRHRNTIRRAYDAGKFPNAYQREGKGPWLVPVTDLIAAGYPLQAPQDEPVRVAEVDALRREVADLRRRADVAEALAAERAGRITDLQLALRMLEAHNPQPGARPEPPRSDVPPPVRHPTTTSRLRRWWNRSS